MEPRISRSDTVAKTPAGVEWNDSAPETKMVRSTNTPDENDPSWEKLGATNVVESKFENAGPATNYTEFSRSVVLGKNVTQIGDFKLLRKLGEGAMGAVYKAEQVSFKRIVALKVLFPHVAANEKLVARMYREGLVMGQLDHPNIIQAYAVDKADDYHFVAMEYVSGQSMQKWLLQLGRLSVEDSVRITIDCAKALAYAHAQGMVHRDIKPDNILVVNKTGAIKVADLGMVKTHDEDMSLTQTGHAVGTPWYMPLEQARNAKEIDGRSDIYALGCTLYAFLTGGPPFMGRTIVDVIQAKEVGRFTPARKANPDVPDRLDMIIAKMAAKLPKARYQTCEELIADLEGLNLASRVVSFVANPAAAQPDETPPLGTTRVMDAGAKAKADAVTPDPDDATVVAGVWYMQTKTPDGTQVARKYSTAQLIKMLEEGTISPKSRISQSANDGFRAIATFKEFQGVALGKVAKAGADKTAVRYRNLYKKIEEQDREREEKATPKPETLAGANTRYWLDIALKVLPYAIGIVIGSLFVGWLVWSLR